MATETETIGRTSKVSVIIRETLEGERTEKIFKVEGQPFGRVVACVRGAVIVLVDGVKEGS